MTSASSERERILRRLKKILALTQSSTPGEAAAALHQAQKIMEAHNLTEQDVVWQSIKESRVPLSGADLPKWESALVSVVVRALGVQAMVERQAPKRGAGRRDRAKVVFVSDQGREELAAYAFQTLRRQLVRDLDAAMRKLMLEANVCQALIDEKKRMPIPPAWREQYALGWCSTLSQKVGGLVNAADTPSHVSAYLEDATKGVAAQQKSAAQPKDESTRRVGGVFAFMGVKDGRNAQLHRAVNTEDDIPLSLDCPS